MSASPAAKVLGLLCLPALAAAQLPEARLSSVTPTGTKAGTSITVSLTGTDLEDAGLRFSHPHITAVRDEKDAKKFTIQVPAGVPPGSYDVRAAGRFGLSNPRVFEVSALDETDASPKALTQGSAQELALPCVVRGNALKQANQWFKLQPAAGRELVLDCHAQRLDSRMEPLLILCDASGRELARARTRPLHWTPASDEPLFLCLRDFLSNGGPEHFYRLYGGTPAEVQSSPQEPLVFWPPFPQAASEVEPNAPANAQKVHLPFEVRGEFFPARDTDAFEFEAKKGEVWWVELTSQRRGAPTNPRIVIEQVLKESNGKESLNNPLVLDEAPWFSGDPDFDGYHFDPIGKFEVKEDGMYRLVASDLNNAITAGHRRVYALSVRRPSPDFALVCSVLTPVQNKAYATFNGPLVSVRAANIRAGQVLPLRVFAIRRDGFDGEITLKTEGLPAGISAEHCAIAKGQNEGVLLLRAAQEAAPWAGAFNVIGMAKLGEAELVHPAKMSTPVWESTVTDFVEPARNRFAREVTLAVVGDACFPALLRAGSIAIDGGAAISGAEAPSFEAGASDKIKVPLRVETRSGEPALVKVKAAGLPGLEKAKDLDIPAKDANAEYELDLAPLKLSPGRYTLWFKGDQKTKLEVKGKQAEVSLMLCSNPLFLTIREAKK